MRKILMPLAGKSGGPLTVRKWLKREGESVAKGEIVALADCIDGPVELEAAEAGWLRHIIVPAGKTVAAGAEIAEMDGAGAADAKASGPAAEAKSKENVTNSTTASGVVIPVLMPQVGNSMEEGTIVRWLVKEGDRIAKGQAIFEIETDKATVEVEATDAGRLAKIIASEKAVVPVKQPVAYLAEKDADVASLGAAPVNGSANAAAPAALNGSAAHEAEAAKPAALPSDAVPVLMPQVGNSMEEGTIVRWLVKEGDRITKGQAIFEIETDKATVEVEATDAGRLSKIVAGEKAVVLIKQPVAYLSEKDIDLGQIATAATAAAAPQAAVVSAPAKPAAAMPAAVAPVSLVAATGPVKASPAARRIARDTGLDLASIGTGSGPGGRILSGDLVHAKARAPQAASEASSPRAGKAAVAPLAALTATETVRRKMSKMRRAIAANLQMSKQTVPHFYLRGTIDAGALMAYYRAEKTKYPCSVNDVVTLACAKIIVEFPAFRSKIDKDEMVEYPAVNIGVAVGVEDGLTVPVLLNAHAMNLQQIAANTRRIVESARGGKLEGMGQGNFTITNLGMFGVEEFAAIVNPPEPGILAVGAVREDVIVKDGFMKPGKVMTMTLSCDHRIVDGLLAAKFMARLKEVLENPTVLG